MRNFRIVTFSLLMAAIGVGFLVGINYQKKIDLEQCKQAGWKFIDRELKPAFGEYDDELYIAQIRRLQSRIATDCIIRIK